MRNLLRHTWHLPRNAIALCITGYQRTLSPDHGPLKGLYTYGYCRHEPTCSVFSKNAVLKRGAIIGTILAMGRVLTCHPWRKLSAEKIMKLSHR